MTEVDRTALADALPWSSGGPILSDELQAEVRSVLGELGASFGLAELPAVLDHESASAAVEAAWDAVRATETGRPDASRPRPELYRLHLLDRRLAELRLDRASEANETLANVVRRLEAAPCSVSDLIRLIPQLICELGFSRGLISRVEDNIWTPELMYVVGDPTWAEELTKLGQAQPQALTPGLFETELVRTQRSILARNVQDEPWRSHHGLAPASQTRSYVAAPILSGGEVVGILHGERYGQRRDVDSLDRQMLASFAEAVRIALSRAALAEELAALHRRATATVKAADAALGSIHDVPSIRLTREPGESADGVLIRSGPAGSSARPLPIELSRRELEVLALMAAGKTNVTIAHRLSIAEGTVKQHVKHILRKLMVGSRAEAVARWFQAGGDPGLD